MGYYKITIKGLGSHHNKDNKADADKMAFTFVHDLKMAGHNISHATFQKISPMDEDDLLKIGGYIDRRNEMTMFDGGESTALTMEQVREIEQDKYFAKDHISTWNNTNFRKLLDTVKVLYAEIDKLKP